MYKILVTEVTEYPETTEVYDADDGKRYTNTYRIPEGKEYKTVSIKTGKILNAEREIYKQDFEAADLTNIIKAVNAIE